MKDGRESSWGGGRYLNPPTEYNPTPLTHTLLPQVWPDGVDGGLFFIAANLLLCYLVPLVLIVICYVGIWVKVSRWVILG